MSAYSKSLPFSKSTAAVASSNTMILFFLRMALAIHNNCLCPTLKFSPSIMRFTIESIYFPKQESLNRLEVPTQLASSSLVQEHPIFLFQKIVQVDLNY